LKFESVNYSSHGISIKGWFIPATTGSKPEAAIVLVHGWSSNAAMMLPLARVLAGGEFSVLLYDARGHGASGNDGPITIRKMAEDVIAGVDFLSRRSDVDQSRIGILGSSMGGSSAILAASIEHRIRAVVSISAFANPSTITKDFLHRIRVPSWPCHPYIFKTIERWLGSTMNEVAPEIRIDRVPAPLLLIHGEADREISPVNLRALWNHASKVNATKVLIPNRGHYDVLRDIGCSEAVTSFFSRHLSAP
jgi:pimeloyl-ACP methyl ester carboxylesterase